jgi:hypothetical protein
MDCSFCGDNNLGGDFPDDRYCEPCLTYLDQWYGGFDEAVPKWTITKMLELRLIPEGDLRCYLCGEMPESREVEHVHPLSKDGEDCLSNIGLACQPCNLRKGARVIEVLGDSLDRLKSQQATFLRCYRTAQEHLPAAFRQTVTELLWETHGFDEEPIEPGELSVDDVAEAIVEALDRMPFWLVMDQPEDGSIPKPFAEWCVEYGEPLFSTYASRAWIPERPNEEEIGFALGTAIREYSW